MKLRISAESLRFRLSPNDIDQLRRHGDLEESLQISLSLKWGYALKLSKSSQLTHLNTTAAEFSVILPEAGFLNWLDGKDLEWNYEQVSPRLRISIEKDLKPHRR